MHALKASEEKTLSTESRADKTASRHASIPESRGRHDAVRQAAFLQKIIGNQATLRAIRQAAAGNTTEERPSPAALLGAIVRARIAHELTHVVHQPRSGRVQRVVSGDVLSVQFTRAMVDAMTDEELDRQMRSLRNHLLETPHDAGAAENLSILESVARQRDAVARHRDREPREPSPMSDRAVSAMSATERLIEAYRRADIGDAVRAKVESIFTPEALVLAIISFAVVFVASQLTPVGWAADIGMALTGVFLGAALFTAISHLVNFARARDATTSEELDAAGREFAAAVAEVEIDVLLLLITHGLGGPRGGAPLEGSPPPSVRIGIGSSGGLVVVSAGTVPATIPVATALELASQAVIVPSAVMMAASGPGGPPQRPVSSGGRGRGGPPRGRSAEELYIERLKERFPRLRQLDIRPRARPTASRYVGPAEDVTPEVGGSPEYRTQSSGAPEFAFEERMRTSQGGFSLNIIDEGVVMEIDGISIDGWLENVKIEQRLSNIDNILARLRVEADFAEAYGLRGVHYSIAPAAVGDEVEARVAAEGLRNVFRVE